MPYATNLTWKHQVPWSARWRGRRLSVTLRAFEDWRQRAVHESPKTTKFYHRTSDQITLDEIERIAT